MSRTQGEAGLHRREFMILSATGAALGVGVASTERAAASGDGSVPSRSVLGAEDLVDGEAYVEWRVDSETAPLSQHLDATVAGFTPADGIVAGFVATARAEGPASVESAVFPGAGTHPGIADAVDDWIRREHAGTTTRTSVEPGIEVWSSTAESRAEVHRVDRVAGDVLAITTASGDVDSTLDPRSAVAYYAGIVRSKVNQRRAAGEEL